MADGVSTELAPALVKLSRLLLKDLELPEVLNEIARIAQEAMASSYGVSLWFRLPGNPDQLAASNDTVSQLQLRQQKLAEGPEFSVLDTKEPISSAALASDQRWPRFAARASRTGLRSVLSLALHGTQPLGSITFYGQSVTSFDGVALDTAQALADHVATVLSNALLVEQARRLAAKLEWSVGEGAWVERAIGILMSRRALGPDEALAALREQSQRQNVKLTSLAQQLVLEAVRRAKHRIADG